MAMSSPSTVSAFTSVPSSSPLHIGPLGRIRLCKLKQNEATIVHLHINNYNHITCSLQTYPIIPILSVARNPPSTYLLTTL